MRVEKVKGAIKSVTQRYTKMRRKEERGRRFSRSSYMYQYSDRVTVREVAFQVMEKAYMKASGGGKYVLAAAAGLHVGLLHDLEGDLADGDAIGVLVHVRGAGEPPAALLLPAHLRVALRDALDRTLDLLDPHRRRPSVITIADLPRSVYFASGVARCMKITTSSPTPQRSSAR